MSIFQFFIAWIILFNHNLTFTVLTLVFCPVSCDSSKYSPSQSKNITDITDQINIKTYLIESCLTNINVCLMTVWGVWPSYPQPQCLEHYLFHCAILLGTHAIVMLGKGGSERWLTFMALYGLGLCLGSLI